MSAGLRSTFPLTVALLIAPRVAASAAAVSLPGDPTSQLIAYVTELYSQRRLTPGALRAMIASATLRNPIGKSETTPGLVSHREGIDAYLADPSLDHERVREAVRKRLAATRRATKQKRSATERTRYWKLEFAPIEEREPLWIKPPYSGAPPALLRPEFPYELQATLLTRHQWRSVMGSEPKGAGRDGDLPVSDVSLDAVAAFLQRLNATSSTYHYFLPTEAQWVYAATDSGRDLSLLSRKAILGYAWLSENANGRLHPVATRKPMRIGGRDIYDLVGNLFEVTRRPQVADNAIAFLGGSGSSAAAMFTNPSAWWSQDALGTKKFFTGPSDRFWQARQIYPHHPLDFGFRLARSPRPMAKR